MSQFRRTHQLIEFESDEFILNKKRFLFTDKIVDVTFSEAVGASPITMPVHFSRSGNIATICFVDNVYNGEQAAGLIKSQSLSIPPEFRPDHEELIHGVMVINGSAGGATASQATQLGSMLIRPEGDFQVGIGVNNVGVLGVFGGGASSGSGNGLVKGVYSYPITLEH